MVIDPNLSQDNDDWLTTSIAGGDIEFSFRGVLGYVMVKILYPGGSIRVTISVEDVDRLTTSMPSLLPSFFAEINANLVQASYDALRGGE